MKLTLESLQVLDAIERKGSFAAAAASLNRVPSAISYTVQKLEQDLGITLFQKQGRRSALTGAGRLLVEQGRLLLQAAEQLEMESQQLATGWEPRLRIAVDHTVAPEPVLDALAALYREQPGIQVSLQEEVLGGTWEALLEDQVDLVIGAVDPVPGHKGIRHLPWQSQPFVFAVSAEHPICQAPLPLTAEAIREYRLVSVKDSSRNQPAISRGILGQEDRLQVTSIQQKLQAQRQALGVGTLPRHCVQPFLDSGEMVELPLADTLTGSVSHIAWKISNRGRALAYVVEHLQQGE